MKWIGTFVLILSVAASLQARADAGPAGHTQAVSHTVLERQLRKLDVQWLAAVAHGNAAFLDRMSTGRYAEIIPNGQVVTKAEILKKETLAPGKSGPVLKLVCFRLRALYGDVAIVTEHLTREAAPGDAHAAARSELGTLIFVKENGEWKIAATALYPVGYKPSKAAVQEPARKSALEPKLDAIEKELWEVDQKWEETVRNKDVSYLAYLFTRQCFIILPGPRLADRLELLHFVARAPRGHEVKAYPDEFKLRSVFGDFAIATDRTVLKGAVVRGATGSVEFRTLKFFVKQDGAWKVAGASDIPIIRAR